MKLGETKGNFTVDETKRNEFRLVSCFAKLKKHAKLETLLWHQLEKKQALKRKS
jgi:hypothetical protein